MLGLQQIFYSEERRGLGRENCRVAGGLVKDRQIKAELGEAGRRGQVGGAPALSRTVAAQAGPSERVPRITPEHPHPRSGAPTFQPLWRERMQMVRDSGKTQGAGHAEPGTGAGCGRKVPVVLSPSIQPKVFPQRPVASLVGSLSLPCRRSPPLSQASRWA